ncbi:hypothetical protein PQ460_09895 [Paenibacillus sp. KACC 21273]|uniref:hypothetical protein n=1 Tax=Paenibacillus sp. KACC 21273 TaxID=3025665 RepID=UPI002366A719|nr:hypothetical protein [Paenibacillus sp. KACC 21273]WDF52696.1 hypothetical protein PQ460_09895 [Paenibacillus sp. KACC 21273]
MYQLITNEKLIIFAKELGYNISETQIKNWRKIGLIPPSKRISNGKSGSSYVYPESALSNLKLILSSLNYKKNQKKLLIDVWFKSGEIKSSIIIKVIDSELEWIDKRIRKVSHIIPDVEKKIKNVSKSSIQKLKIFSNTSLDNTITTMNVLFNVMSPNGNPHIWSDFRMEDSEESSAKIANKATGFNNLYTGEDLWSEIKKNISIEKLRKSVKKVKVNELNKIKLDAELLVEFIKNLKVISFFSSTQSSWINLIVPNKIEDYIFRISILTIIIHFYRSQEEKSILEEFLKQTRLQQKYLNVLADYTNYMKTHPYLKRKKRWNINKCDEKTFTSLQEHQQKYINNHSEEIQKILNFNTL